jgi:hypothetical protein
VLPCSSSPRALPTGYLERDASDKLLKLLADRSAPGSRVLVTCPPAPEQKHRAAAAVDALTSGGPGAAEEAAAVAVAPDNGSAAHQANVAAAAVVSVATVTDEPAQLHGVIKLHHSTFEDPGSTQSRWGRRAGHTNRSAQEVRALPRVLNTVQRQPAVCVTLLPMRMRAVPTAPRVSAAGWSAGCQLLTAAALAAKYGVETAQPIVVAALATAH